MERESTVTQMGMDSHGKFSRVTSRDAKGEIVWRQRLCLGSGFKWNRSGHFCERLLACQ